MAHGVVADGGGGCVLDAPSRSRVLFAAGAVPIADDGGVDSFSACGVLGLGGAAVQKMLRHIAARRASPMDAARDRADICAGLSVVCAALESAQHESRAMGERLSGVGERIRLCASP